MTPGGGLTAIDVAVVAVYLTGVIALGLYLSRRGASSEDFFLASRTTTWPVIGLSLLASNISSTTLVGLAGAAYAIGISVYDYEWVAAVVLVFFCVFFLPFLLRTRIYTLPEFLERRFNGAVRSYFSLLTLFLNIVVDAASALYGGALLLSLLMPGVPLWEIVVGLALSAGVYTALGGLRSVIYTETVQAVLLLCASAMIAATAFSRAGGLAHVLATVDPKKLSLLEPLDSPGVPWLGLLTGVPLLGFYFWCTNQFMVQRVLSAKNEAEGRLGSLFAGLLKLPVLFLMVLPGTAAILLFPGLKRADMVYPTLLLNLLPSGLLGLALAGFLAALMSSTASTFNSGSTLVTMDFVRRMKPELGDKQLVRIGRMTTVALMALACVWAPQIQYFPSLWQYLQAVLAYAVPPIVALYLVGLFWRRANGKGAVAALATGVLAGLSLFVAVVVLHLIQLHFLYVAAILFALSAGVLVVASLLTAPDPPERTQGLVWTPSFFNVETLELRGQPWWRNYRILAVGLLIVTALVVAPFLKR